MNKWRWFDLARDDLRSCQFLCRVCRSDWRAVPGNGRDRPRSSRLPKISPLLSAFLSVISPLSSAFLSVISPLLSAFLSVSRACDCCARRPALRGRRGAGRAPCHVRGRRAAREGETAARHVTAGPVTGAWRWHRRVALAGRPPEVRQRAPLPRGGSCVTVTADVRRPPSVRQ